MLPAEGWKGRGQSLSPVMTAQITIVCIASSFLFVLFVLADVLCLFNDDVSVSCAILYDIWVLQYREMLTSAINIAMLPNHYDH